MTSTEIRLRSASAVAGYVRSVAARADAWALALLPVRSR
jgi:hypothetical protein